MVFFIPVENSKDIERTGYLLKILIKESGLFKDIEKNSFVPIKLTFGEKDNRGFINPRLVKIIVDRLKARGARPFLTDTSVIYQGKRMNAVDHLELAYVHGFVWEEVNCPVIIGDGLLGENSLEVEINKKHIKKAHIVRFLFYIDHLLTLSHFTGHLLTGFGATLKNLGMGFATRKGKLLLHANIKPKVISKNCRFCKFCIKSCPAKAIVARGNVCFIREEVCIGCGECLVACKFGAIEVNYGENVDILSEKIVEYAYAVLKDMKRKIFFNFLTHITKECDCMAKDEPVIVPDIGILISTDPVAIDKAGLDLIREKSNKDIFRKLHPQASQPETQLEYAQEIGLGKLEYELVKIKI